VGYHVADASAAKWEERPLEGQADRQAADVTTAAELKQSRARLWRYPPHTRGRRHADHAQEEVFVVLSGKLTMLLGDPPERVDVRLLEHELAVRCVDSHRVTVGEIALEQPHRERVLQQALDRALQRTRTVRRIPAGFGERFLRRNGQLELDPAVREPFTQPF